MTEPHSDDTDELLEFVIERLQSMPIPARPQHNFDQHSRGAALSRRRMNIAGGWCAAAAAIVVIAWAFHRTLLQDDARKQPMSIASTAPAIEVDRGGFNQSLDGYLTRLEQLRRELDHLKQAALLLDARDKAEQLMVRYANDAVANNVSSNDAIPARAGL